MQHFSYLNQEQFQELFYRCPEPISRRDSRERLAHGLGATLYFPAVKQGFSEIYIENRIPGLISSVVCMEDSIDDSKIQIAEENIRRELMKLHAYGENHPEAVEEMPLLFIRVRSPEHFERMLSLLSPYLSRVAGFVLPKFNGANGEKYLQLVQQAQCYGGGAPIYGMPILESSDIIYWESRKQALQEVYQCLEVAEPWVLNVRIGATDFSGLFGLRRGHDHTVYDIQVIRDCITDILNVFTRSSRSFVVSGPVWEYFWSEDRMLKPRLRVTPFRRSYGQEGEQLRTELLNEYVDGLLEEVLLDKLNGIIGKTVIHPTHIIPVQGMYAVTHEDYLDAVNILNESCHGHGVIKSSYNNRMNEKKTHINWARRLLILAEIYGVLNPDVDHIRLISATR